MKLTSSMQEQWRQRHAQKKLKRLTRDVSRGGITINDAREKLGLLPFPDPACDELLLLLPEQADERS